MNSANYFNEFKGCWVCQLCGAMVASIELHQRWHSMLSTHTHYTQVDASGAVAALGGSDLAPGI